MNIKRVIFGFAAAVVMALGMAGCAKGGDSSSSSAGVLSNVADLPKVTDPVVKNGTTYQKTIFHTGDESPHATTGTRLLDFNSKDWSEAGGLERAACESASVYREVMNNAIESSKIQCYLGAMLAEEKFDANYHLFDMEGMKDPGRGGDPQGPKSFKVKIKASKDANGNINNFEVFACSSGSQEMYGKQSINAEGATIDMVFKNDEKRAEESFSHMGKISANGTLNSLGQWTTKNVTAFMTENSSSYHDPDGSGAQLITSNSSAMMTLQESPDHILLGGFRDGTYGGEAFTERFLTAVGLIIPEGAGVLQRELTAGSAKRIFSHNNHTSGETQQEEVHWATNLSSATTSHWADLLTGEPPAVQAVSTGFSAQQTWDCTGEFETFDVDLSMMAKFEQCEGEDSRQDQWIDCWVNDQYQPPEPAPKPEPPPEEVQPVEENPS